MVVAHLVLAASFCGSLGACCCLLILCHLCSWFASTAAPFRGFVVIVVPLLASRTNHERTGFCLDGKTLSASPPHSASRSCPRPVAAVASTRVRDAVRICWLVIRGRHEQMVHEEANITSRIIGKICFFFVLRTRDDKLVWATTDGSWCCVADLYDVLACRGFARRD